MVWPRARVAQAFQYRLIWVAQPTRVPKVYAACCHPVGPGCQTRTLTPAVFEQANRSMPSSRINGGGVRKDHGATRVIEVQNMPLHWLANARSVVDNTAPMITPGHPILAVGHYQRGAFESRTTC